MDKRYDQNVNQKSEESNQDVLDEREAGNPTIYMENQTVKQPNYDIDIKPLYYDVENTGNQAQSDQEMGHNLT